MVIRLNGTKKGNGGEIMKELLYQCANCDYEKVLPDKDGYSCPKCGGYFRPITDVISNTPYKPAEIDNVNHPNHYANKEIEVIDYIKDTLTDEQYKGYCRANVIKYISRYDKKNGVEDLKKANVYLDWLIKAYEEA